jgi:hypothetical protein
MRRLHAGVVSRPNSPNFERIKEQQLSRAASRSTPVGLSASMAYMMKWEKLNLVNALPKKLSSQVATVRALRTRFQNE